MLSEFVSVVNMTNLISIEEIVIDLFLILLLSFKNDNINFNNKEKYNNFKKVSRF